MDDSSFDLVQSNVFNPVAVRRISVEKLFGHYSYSLVPKQGNENLILIYGDNGVGKTTILKLLFHLLSQEDKSGHRTTLFRLKFRRFSVELNNGHRITVSRSSQEIEGDFQILYITPDKEFRAEFISKQNDKIVARVEDDWQALREQLRRLRLNLFFVRDDRRIHNFRTRPLVRTSLSEVLEVQTDRLVHSTLQSDDGMTDLEKAIARVDEWARAEIHLSNKRGEGNIHTVYNEIVSSIVAGPSDSRAVEELLNRMRSLSARTMHYSKLGLVKSIDMENLQSALSLAEENRRELIYQVLVPYVTGLEARLDALQNIQEKITLFVNTMNSFFVGKRVAFSYSSGIRIHSPSGEFLNAQDLSSGEKQMMMMFCMCILTGSSQSLVLIDEPELSLNIKWQRRILRSIIQCSGPKTQFVIATHSPEVLGPYLENVVKIPASSLGASEFNE